MDQELMAYLEERFRESSREMRSFREETMSRFEQVDEAIRQNREAIRQNREATEQNREAIQQNKDEIRYTQIMVEGLRSDLQGVAEGVLSNTQRIDALREDMKQEVGEVRKTLDSSYKDISKRVRSLEEWRKQMSEDPAPRLRKNSGKKS